MAEDAILQEDHQQNPMSFAAPSSGPQPSAMQQGDDGSTPEKGRIAYRMQKDGSLALSKENLPAYEEIVFSLITNNNGKLRFIDLMDLVGGQPHKNILYKALASLARQGSIERIRGMGKKRIEFYYYDTKKIKKRPTSASVTFV
jgi:hypothetical protein